MRINLPLKLFIIWLGVMLLIVFFTLPEEREDKLESISFSTTESAELYFKNVRSFYYQTAEEGEGHFEVYRLERLFEDESQPTVPFALYNNWRQNQAFVRLDTAALRRLKVEALITQGDSIRVLTLPGLENEDQFVFARSVFRAIERGERLGLESSGSTVWIEDTQRSAIKRSLNDYFKLIGKI
jgi:hypothetical protein